MNGYKAVYRGKQLDVYADTSFAAQKKAAELFRAKKSYDVSVYLCEKDTNGTKPGEQVFQSAE